MGKYYVILLESIIDNPGQSISLLPILTRNEKHKILVEWNNTNAPYPKDKTIHQLFEEQVQKTPDNIAVVYENQELTYRELNEQSNQLAYTIRREYQGNFGEEIKGDTLIGIYIERSIDMIVGILGILKSGAAYVPFDTVEPDNRIKYKINDCGCRMIVTSSKQSEYLEFIKEIDILPYDIGSSFDKLSKTPCNNPKHINQSNDLVYVIYTSGSTGHPKGVMTEHKSLVNSLIYLKNELKLSDSDVFMLKTPISFDASKREIFLALLNGIKLVVSMDRAHLDPGKLFNYLIDHSITVINIVPTMLNSLLDEINKKDREVIKSLSLKRIYCSGEVLSCELAEKAYNSIPNITLTNLYGMTESTMTQYRYIVPNNITNFTIPIGRPFHNHKTYILDEYKHVVPIGIPGELYIGGDGLARGYLNRPYLTKERFIENPFITEEDKAKNCNLRIYKTGDLVKWLPDGNLEFIGRNDNQVKIRGFRVELGEIESKLIELSRINECAVLCKEHNNNKYLAAYYTSEKEINLDGFRAFLSKNLPDYMIPNTFIHLEFMPLTTSGKIDRRVLPNPEIKPISDIYVGPRTPIEEIICKIWQEVLEIKKIGIHDNFFSMGGHSMNALRLIVKIDKQLGSSFPLKAIYSLSTVAEMAKIIDKGSRTISSVSKRKINCNIPDLTYKKLLSAIVASKAEQLNSESLVVLGKESKTDNPPLFWCTPHINSEFASNNYMYQTFVLYSGGALLNNNEMNDEYFRNLAEYYCEEIIKIYNSDEYILGGYCHGARLASFLVFQLQKMGKKVSKLIIVESFRTSLYDFQGDLQLIYGAKSTYRVPDMSLKWLSPWWAKKFKNPLRIEIIPCGHDEMLTKAYQKLFLDMISGFINSDPTRLSESIKFKLYKKLIITIKVLKSVGKYKIEKYFLNFWSILKR